MIIARRFRGPPASANGGYACGAVAGLLGDDGDAEATLRRPPPLDRALVEQREPGRAALLDGDLLVADATPTILALDVPAPVAFDDAERAARAFPWLERHPFPECFACGPARAAGDGLRILPGAVVGREVAAAPWIVDDSIVGADGLVTAPVLWAALDCPSWFGLICFHPFEGRALLGRLAAHVVRRPRAGERCVAAGWFLGRDARKIAAASAIYADDGSVLASARATWIELR